MVLTAVDDDVAEVAETATVALGSLAAFAADTDTVLVPPGPVGPLTALSSVDVEIIDDDPVPVTLGGGGAVTEADTTVTAQVTVTLGRALIAGESFVVPLVVSGVSTADFTLAAASGEGVNTGVTLADEGTLAPSVTFSGAGAQTATLVVTPSDDSVTEADETMTVTLGTLPSGLVDAGDTDRDGSIGIGETATSASVGFSDAKLVWIRTSDGEALGASLAVSEGETVGLTATLGSNTGPLSVSHTVTLRDGATAADYQFPADGSIQIPTGESAVAFTFEAVLDDVSDASEVVRVSFSVPTGWVVSPAVVDFVIHEAADAVFAAAPTDLVLVENADRHGDALALGSPVSATDANGDAVGYSLVSATLASGLPVAGFVIGESSGQVSYAGRGVDFESSGGSVVLLVAATSLGADATPTAVTQQVTVSVTNVDEGPGSVSVSGAPWAGRGTLRAGAVSGDPDGDPSGAVSWQWQRSADVSPRAWSAISGATGSSYAVAGSDAGMVLRLRASYTDGGGFPETAFSDELTVADAGVLTAVARVVDAVATEGSSSDTAAVEVRLDAALAAGETVTVPLVLSSAVLGTDYSLSLPSGSADSVSLSSGAVVFTGPSSSARVLVSALADSDSTSERLVLSVGSVSGSGSALAGAQFAGAVAGDAVVWLAEPGPRPVDVSVSTLQVPEGASVVVTAALRGPPLTADVRVPLTVSGSDVTADDYALSPSSVLIEAGDTSAQALLRVLADGAVEGPESWTVGAGSPLPTAVSAGVSASLSVSDSLRPTVPDVDPPAAGVLRVLVTAPDAVASEGTNDPAVLRVGLSRALASGESLSVPLVFTGGRHGTAVGNDFWASLRTAAGVSWNANSLTVTFTGPSPQEALFDVYPRADADAVSEMVTVGVGALSSSGVSDTLTSLSYAAFRIVDSGTPAVVLTGVAGVLEVSEPDGTVSWRVRLSSRPTHTVTVTPTAAPGSAVTVSAALTFAPADWNRWQTVTATAVDDAVDAAAPRRVVVSHVVTSTDTRYDGASVQAVQIAVADDDPTVVSLTRSDSGTLTEGASAAADRQATFTVELSRALAAGETIQVPLLFSGTGITGSDFSLALDTAGSDTGTSLTRPGPLNATVAFTGAGTQTATLTLTAAVDSLDENSETVAAALGSAAQFKLLGLTNTAGGAAPHASANRESVAIANGDDPLTVTLSSPDGASVSVVEGDASSTVSLTVTLSRPLVAGQRLSVPLLTAGGGWADDLTVALSGTPDNVTVDPAAGTVTFTGPSAAAATVTVAAGDDDDSADETVTVTVPAAAAGYSGQGWAATLTGTGTVTVNTIDDDAGFVVVGAPVAVTEGASGSYTVRLARQPAGPVSVALTAPAGVTATAVAVNDEGRTVTDPTLLFDTANWSTPQTVTVTVADDDIDSPPRSAAVSHTVAARVAADAHLALGDVSVEIADDDPTPVRIGLAGSADRFVRVLETGGTATVEVTLGAAGSVRRLADGEVVDVPLVIGGSAAQGSDYAIALSTTAGHNQGVSVLSSAPLTGTSPVLRFASQADGGTATLIVTVTGDSTDEDADETITVALGTQAAADAQAGTDIGGGTAMATEPDPARAGGSRPQRVTVAVADDDAAAAAVIVDAPDGGIAVVEGDARTAGSYTLRLAAAPTGTATVTATAAAPLRVNLAGDSPAQTAAVTFTAADWWQPQTVTVTAVDADAADAADPATVRITHTVSGYGSVAAADPVDVAVHDNTPTVVTVTGGGTVRENDAKWTAHVQVGLSRPLAAGETVDVPIRLTTTTGAPLSDIARRSSLVWTVTGQGASRAQDPHSPQRTTPFATGFTVRLTGAGAQTATVTFAGTRIDNDRRDETVNVAFNDAAPNHPSRRTNVTGGIAAHATHNSAQVTISDAASPPLSPTASFAAATYTASEAAGSRTATVTVTLTPAPTAPTDVSYTVTGTATQDDEDGDTADGDDYQALSGTVTVGTDGTGTVNITVIDDTDNETPETIVLTLTDGTGYDPDPAAATATITITDNDDDDPLVTVTRADGTALGGLVRLGEGASVELKAALSTGTGPVTVTVATTHLSTIAGDVSFPASIEIAAGASEGTATFAAVPDSVLEDNELAGVAFTVPSGYTVTPERTDFIIIDSTVAVELSRTDGTGAVFESATAADADRSAEFAVVLRRALAAGERVDVPLVISGTGVTAGDFEPLSLAAGDGVNTGVSLEGANTLSPTVIFTGAGARTASPVLTAVADGAVEAAETATVALGSASAFAADTDTNVPGGALPNPLMMSAQVGIVSEEDAAVVSVAAAAPSVVQGANAVFTVSVAQAQSTDLEVGLNASATGPGVRADDLGDKTVTISANTLSAQYRVQTSVLTDAQGSVTVALSPGPYALGSPAEARVALEPRIGAALLISLAGVPLAESGAGSHRDLTVRLTRALAATESMTVPLSVTGAAVGDDFTFALEPSSQTGVELLTAGAYSAQNPAVRLTAGARQAVVRFAAVDNDRRSQPYVTIGADPDAVTASGGIRVGAVSGGPHSFEIEDDETGAVEVPWDWPLLPEGLSDGDGFRLLFVTTAQRDAVPATTAFYDDFAAAAAAGGHAALVPFAGWVTALVSTSASDARARADMEHTSSEPGVAVFWAGGTKAADDYADFFDGDWDDEAAPRSQLAAAATANAAGYFTGSGHDGTRRAGFEAGTAGTVGIGKLGDSTSGHGPLSAGAAARDDELPLYAVTPVLTFTDTRPTVTVTAGAAVTEGTTAEFTVTADTAPAEDLEVTVTVADAPGADFVDEGSHRVTITAGETTATLEIDTTADDTDEPSGAVTATVTVSDAGSAPYRVGSPAETMVVVSDDDPTTVTLGGGGAVSEADTSVTAQVTVTLGRPLAAGESFVVPLVIAGVTTGDFTLTEATGDGVNTGVTLGAAGTLAPTVTFSGAGAATAVLAVSAVDDSVDEAAETMTVTLGVLPAGTVDAGDTDRDGSIGAGETATSVSVEFSDDAADAADAVFGSAPTDLVLAENADRHGDALALGSPVSATDANSDPIVYSLVSATTAAGRPAAGFTIDAASGQVSYGGRGVDFESSGGSVVLTVQATSRGADATPTAVTQQVTVRVTNVDEGAGAVSVTGAAQAGRGTLRYGGVSGDPDGDPSGSVSWQWQRSADVSPRVWSAISGATSSSYAVAGSDAGMVLRLRASYADGGGFSQTAFSDEFAVADAGQVSAVAQVTDAVATEGSSSDTAAVTVRLDAALRSGESVSVPLLLGGEAAPSAQWSLGLAADPPTGVTLSAAGAVTFTGPTSATATVLVSALADSDTVSERLVLSVGSVTGSGPALAGAQFSGVVRGDATVWLAEPGTRPVDVSVSPLLVSEGASVVVTAALRGAPLSADVRVPLAVTGSGVTAGDYVLVPSSVLIRAGDTEAEAVLRVRADGVVEGPESWTIGVGSPLPSAVSGGVSASLSVSDSVVLTVPDITLSVDDDAVSEGDGATLITVTARVNGVAGYADARTVAVTVAGSGGDGRVGFAASPSTFDIVIAAGAATASGTFTLTPTDNQVDEAYEVITVSGASSGVTVRSAWITLSDDDPPPPPPPGVLRVLVTAPDAVASEGTGDGAQLRVALSRALVAGESLSVPLVFTDSDGPVGPNPDFGVDLQTAAGVSYNRVRRTVTFTGPSPQQALLDVTAWSDADAVSEAVAVGVGTLSASGVSETLISESYAVFRIVDSGRPAVLLTGAAGVLEVSEPDGTVSYQVRLSSRPTQTVTVTPTVPEGAAVSVSAPLVFAPADWDTAQTVTVTAVDDNIDAAASRRASVSHVVTSTDADYDGVVVQAVQVAVADDDPTVVSLTRSDSDTITEGAAAAADRQATFTVELSRALAAGETIQVPLLFGGVGVTGSDFSLVLDSTNSDAGTSLSRPAPLSATVTFTDAGAQTATLTLTAAEDSLDESAETLAAALGTTAQFKLLGLTNTAGGAVPHASTANKVAFVVIADGDDPLTVTLSSPDGASVTVVEGDASSTASLTVTLSRAPVAGQRLAVPLLASGGTFADDLTAVLSGSPEGVSLDAAGVVTFTGPSAVSATVTVAARGDADSASESITVTVPASAAGYGGEGWAATLTGTGTVTVDVSDDDAGFIVVGAPLEFAEGASGSYTVRLARRPAGQVTVALAAPAGVTATATVVNDEGATVTVPNLLFDADNWAIPQTVTVADAAADDIDRPDRTAAISHTVTASNAADAHLRLGDVTVTVVDDAPTPVRIGLAGSAGGGFVRVLETGGTATVEVTLGEAGSVRRLAAGEVVDVPLAVGGTATLGSDYTIALSTTAGHNQGVSVVSGSPLTSAAPVLRFAAHADGGIATLVLSVTGDAADEDADETITVALGTQTAADAQAGTAIGGGTAMGTEPDPANPGADRPQQVTVAVADDDAATAAVIVDVPDGGISVVEGDAATAGFYTLRLTTAPTGTVTVTATAAGSLRVNLAGDSPAQTAAATFTTANWWQPQTVTVAAVDADAADSADPATVRVAHTVAGYGAVTTADPVDVAVHDNTATVVSVTGGGTVRENDSRWTAEVQIQLSRPLAAGETVDVPIRLTTSTGAPLSDRARRSAVSWTVTGQGASRVVDVHSPQRTTPFATGFTVRLSGAGAQTATVTFAGTRIDNDRSDETVNVAFNSAAPNHPSRATNVTGGITAHPTDTSARITVSDASSAPLSPRAAFAAAAYTVSEAAGTRTVGVTVTLTPAPASPTAVAYTVAGTATQDDDDGDDTDGDDYEALSGTVTVGTDGTGTITITVIDDDDREPSETVVLAIADGTGYDPDPAADTTTVTIADNDSAGVTVSESGSPAVTAVAEDGSDTDTYTVALDTQPLTNVVVRATAAAGAQIDGPAAGRSWASTADLTFTPANWATAQTVTVRGVDDDVDNVGDARTVRVTHAVATGDTGGEYTTAMAIDRVDVTVNDDDTAGVTVTESGSPAVTAVAEDGSDTDTYTVVLDSEPLSNVVVRATAATGVQVDGPAAGASFGSSVDLTFTPANWATAQTVTVQGVDDHVDNVGDARTVRVAHAVTTGDTGGKYTTSMAVDRVDVTLSDDDAAPSGVVLSVDESAVDEGDGATVVTVTATVGGGTRYAAARTVAVEVAGSGADGVVGFTAVPSFSIVIPAGAALGTGMFTLTPAVDVVDEAAETVTVSGTSSGVTVTSATIALSDDDDPPSGVVLSVDESAVDEGDGATAVTVTATVGGGTRYAAARTVAVEVAGSGADGVVGFAAAPSTFNIVIPAGAETATGMFTLTPTDNMVDEADETITVSGTSTGATVTSATITLSDDDVVAPTVMLVLSPQSIAEGAQSTVTATLSAASSSPVTVVVSAVAGANTAAADFTLSAARTLTIAAGETTSTGTVTITAAGDDVDGPNKSVTVSGAASGGGAANPASVTLTITDDDTAGVTVTESGSPAGTAVDEDGTDTDTYTVVLDSEPLSNVVVRATAATGVQVDGPAAGASFGSSVDLTFTPANWATAQTVTVRGDDDDIDNVGDARTVRVTHAVQTGDTGGKYTTAMAIDRVDVTVNDDDAAPSGITLSVDDDAVGEGDGATVITVTATVGGGTRYAAARTVAVTVAGSGVSGRVGFTAAPSPFDIVIPAGAETGTGMFTLTPTDNMVDEADETITVSGTSSGATVTSATITLSDDDVVAPTVMLVLSPQSIAEGAQSTVTATLSAASSSPVTVVVSAVAGANTAAADFTLSAARTLTIAAGETTSTGTVTITAAGDDVDGPNKSVTVSGAASGGGAANPASVTLTITDDDTAGVTVTESGSPAATAVDEDGTDTDTYTVVLDSEPLTNVVVRATAATGVQVDGPGAGRSWGSTADLTFTPVNWATAQTVTVRGVDDNIENAGGARTVRVAHAVRTGDTGGKYTSATAIDPVDVTVNDDDAAVPVVPELSVGDVTVDEGGSAVFAVSLSAPSSQTVTVQWRTAADGVGTSPATAGTDYTAVSTAQTVTFAAGATSRTVSVQTTADTVDELNETFLVVLSSPSNATVDDGTGVGTIRDDDTAELSIADVTVTEGAVASFTITLAPVADRAVTVQWRTAAHTSGTYPATAGTDYTAVSAAQTVTFAAGASSATVQVQTTQDSLDENNETFLVQLSSPTIATIDDGTGAGTINDDDAAPTVSVGNPAATVAEGDDSGVTANMAFPVTLSAVSGKEVTVEFSLGGDATGGSDYTAPSPLEATIAAGATTASIVVKVRGDTVDEEDETVEVTLTGATNAVLASAAADREATGTIRDDDEAHLSVGDTTVTEGGAAVFTITLDPVSDRTVTVQWTTAEHTAGTNQATAGTDYTAVTTAQTVTFAPGASSATIEVQTTRDNVDDNDETFLVQLSNPTNAALDDGEGVGTISETPCAKAVNDPGTPCIKLRGGTHWRAIEGDDLFLTFTAIPAPTADLTVTVRIVDAPGADFLDPSNEGLVQFTIPKGTSIRQITVETEDDDTFEPSGVITATLVSGAGYEVGAPKSMSAHIKDDDGEAYTSAMTLGGPDNPTIDEGPRPPAKQSGGLDGPNPHPNAAVLELDTQGDFEQGLVQLHVSFGGTADYGSDYIVQQLAGALSARWSDVSVGADGQERWVVLYRDSKLRIVALDDGEIEDLDETVEVSLVGWNITNRTRPRPTITLGSTTHTITISDSTKQPTGDTDEWTDGTADSTDGTEQPTDGADPATDGTEDPTDDTEQPTDGIDDSTDGVEDSTDSAEQSTDDAPSDQPLPELTITGGGGITEGATAKFTITADPAPASPLTVTVGVSESGDFGASGAATITVSGATTTYTVTTGDDVVDESDGSVTAALQGGDGYTVGSPSSATVEVADDDMPTPVVSIAGGSPVMEGTTATFTITAAPPTPAGVAVNVTVSASGDFGVTTGRRTVTVGALGTATLSIETSGDDTDELDGSVTVTLAGGQGYTVSPTHNTAMTAVADDDDPPPVTPVTLSIADASVLEGGILTFEATLSEASDAEVSVRWGTERGYGADHGARDLVDFVPTGGRLVFAAGETVATGVVFIEQDTKHELDEYFTIRLYDPHRATIADGEATITILDDD